MKLLEDKILKDATVGAGGVLKIDSFLGQRIDTSLASEMAKEWKRRFADAEITKIVTIEASGIGIAAIAALEFGVPLVYAKKTKNPVFSPDMLTSHVTSYTHGNTYTVCIPREHINKEDKILIVDDLLANGSALLALADICRFGGAAVVGAGIAVEKAYLSGGRNIRARGLRVAALARIASIGDNGDISFADEV